MPALPITVAHQALCNSFGFPPSRVRLFRGKAKRGIPERVVYNPKSECWYIQISRAESEAAPDMSILALAHAWGHVLSWEDPGHFAHNDAFALAEGRVLRVLLAHPIECKQPSAASAT